MSAINLNFSLLLSPAFVRLQSAFQDIQHVINLNQIVISALIISFINEAWALLRNGFSLFSRWLTLTGILRDSGNSWIRRQLLGRFTDCNGNGSLTNSRGISFIALLQFLIKWFQRPRSIFLLLTRRFPNLLLPVFFSPFCAINLLNKEKETLLPIRLGYAVTMVRRSQKKQAMTWMPDDGIAWWPY